MFIDKDLAEIGFMILYVYPAQLILPGKANDVGFSVNIASSVKRPHKNLDSRSSALFHHLHHHWDTRPAFCSSIARLYCVSGYY